MKEVLAHACAEISEKKSRFIADLFPADTEEAAADFVKSVKKTHYDARHHCFAYRIGKDAVTERASDDGEPQGTAGQPILSVLRGAEITDAVLVVTRYFGGTLLGTGGLVRAYSLAAKEAVAAASFKEIIQTESLTVTVDYAHVDAVLHLLKQYDITPERAEYGASVKYDIVVRSELKAPVCEALQQILHSTAFLKTD